MKNRIIIINGGRKGGKTLAAKILWLASYNRETYSLSTIKAKYCGYGDLLKEGFIVNKGSDEIPDLFITPKGINFIYKARLAQW